MKFAYICGKFIAMIKVRMYYIEEEDGFIALRTDVFLFGLVLVWRKTDYTIREQYNRAKRATS